MIDMTKIEFEKALVELSVWQKSASDLVETVKIMQKRIDSLEELLQSLKDDFDKIQSRDSVQWIKE